MPVVTERRGRVLLVRLDRDAKLNAMDHDMTLGLDAAMNLLEDDAELWAGVLTGNGRAFSRRQRPGRPRPQQHRARRALRPDPARSGASR